MSLLDIKQHLMQVKMATLGALCAYFHSEPEILRLKLEHWVRKGCVRKCTKTPICGTKCFKCKESVTEIYEWVDGMGII